MPDPRLITYGLAEPDQPIWPGTSSMFRHRAGRPAGLLAGRPSGRDPEWLLMHLASVRNLTAVNAREL
jgi:hypothetical protein